MVRAPVAQGPDWGGATLSPSSLANASAPEQAGRHPLAMSSGESDVGPDPPPHPHSLNRVGLGGVWVLSAVGRDLG